jgi:CheY-like chemotaxis protein
MPLGGSDQVPLPVTAGMVATATVAAGTGRILIVDDNTDAAATLEMLLGALGYTTRVANTGMEALDQAAEFEPDVVLLDIGLPGIDGYEVARRLRSLIKRPLKIVAVTGWGQEEDRQRSREAGIDVHLLKPIDAADLQNALGNAGSLH